MLLAPYLPDPLTGLASREYRRGMNTTTANQSTRRTVGAELYVNRIRNTAKRDYARRYLVWLRFGENGEEPSRGKLSHMSAQAVRMALATQA